MFSFTVSNIRVGASEAVVTLPITKIGQRRGAPALVTLDGAGELLRDTPPEVRARLEAAGP